MLEVKNRKALCCCISCNVPMKRSITPEILIQVFKNEEYLEEWRSHLYIFFNELPYVLYQGFMEENDISLEQMGKTFSKYYNITYGKHFSLFLEK